MFSLPVNTEGKLNCEATKRPRVFVSYKRSANPDDALAMQLFQALSSDFDVFIDQEGLTVGSNWAERINEEIRRADFLISLLSSSSLQSEMVVGEIEQAHILFKEMGRPRLLPVRVAFDDSFPYPLSAYLNHLNWLNWRADNDTERIIGLLKDAISTNTGLASTEPASTRIPVTNSNVVVPPYPLAQLEMPEGTMDLQSPYYVVRNWDKIALNAIQRAGVTITIKGPRQVGKSSLLIRIKEAAASHGKEVIFLDFQQLGKRVVGDIELLLRHLCTFITHKLGLPSRVDEYWSIPLENIMRCTFYIEKYVLEQVRKPIVLAMDEVDTLFDSEHRSDIFGMLRSWHNSRADTPAWKKLDLVLVTSTEPYQFIDNLNQSPFNVGEKLEPSDFSADQMADLVTRHALLPSLSDNLMQLLNGHPYLVRRALYVIASEQLSADELFRSATSPRGPFGDHLRYHLFRLHNQTALISGLLQIVRNNTCSDDEVAYRLQSAGLVLIERGTNVVPRCELYRRYFEENLHEQ